MKSILSLLQNRNIYLYVYLLIIIIIVLFYILFIFKNKILKKHSNIKTKSLAIMLTTTFVLLIFSYFFLYMYENFDTLNKYFINKALQINKIKNLDFNKENNKISLEIKLKGHLFVDEIYCLLSNEEDIDINNSNWVLSKDNICKIKKVDNLKNIYLKSKNEIKKFKVEDYINKTFKLNIKKEKIYLIKNDTIKLDYELNYIGSSKNISWKSENENIVTVNNGLVTGINSGKTTVILTDGSIQDKIEIIVTDLISKIHIDNSRPFLSCGRYNEEESSLLEELLFYYVNEAGNQTRAGVVAAARFLSMQFPYKISYFLENGRLTQPERYGDGEGRYYHKGLYLVPSKYSLILKSRSGPAIWGCPILEYDSEVYRPNGLDCSGFVSWAILNGGFDIGDQGANGWSYSDNDLTNHGDRQYITWELLNSRKVKAGDLASIPGHIALVVGIDYTNQMIYIAEELRYSQGLVVLSLSFSELLTHSDFTHLVLMDEYYINDGNYNDMW